jgi:hypothetical protein
MVGWSGLSEKGVTEFNLADRLLCSRNRPVAFGSFNWNFERFTAVQVICMFLDLLVLSVDILMTGDPTLLTLDGVH